LRIKLDENLRQTAVELLAAAGHDVSTVALQGMTSSTDQQVFAACSAERRILVTLDLDFANPAHFPPATSAGIAVCRIRGSNRKATTLACMRQLIGALASTTIAGQLWIVETTRVRVFSGGAEP
jgi:predicted nuclease of predicted toxin-antitoxin system